MNLLTPTEWLLIGIFVYLLGLWFVLSLCRAAANGDRMMNRENEDCGKTGSGGPPPANGRQETGDNQ